MVVAFLAIFSLVAPSFAWACPVTGRTGTPAQVCDRTPSSQAMSSEVMTGMGGESSGGISSVMTCCIQSGAIQCLNTCCQSVPQLPHENEKINTLEQAHTSTATLLSHLSQAAQTIHIVWALPVAPLVIEPSRVVALHDDTSVLPLSPQHAPSAHAGRAPPVS